MGERVPLILVVVGVGGNRDKKELPEMTDKKRKTVTTIETHEVWIIRKPESELSEMPAITVEEIADPPVSVLNEKNKGSERSEGTNYDE